MQCSDIFNRNMERLMNMRFFIFFYIMISMEVTVSMAEQLNCKCGMPSDDIISVRIVGGRRAPPHGYPWTVAILENGKMYCGGALVTDIHVLSAGHCYKWNDIKFMNALVGLDDFDDMTNVENRTIFKVVIHEEFTSTPVRDENDIAVVTLNKPVQFSATVVPICLPMPEQDFSGRVGTIVGWGRLGIKKAVSRVLMKANLDIITDSACMATDLGKYLKPTMMCTYHKGKDGCQGDSGGPLLVFEGDGRYVLAGVISWGIGCANPKYPGVYTKVSKYIDWINLNTFSGNTCE